MAEKNTEFTGNKTHYDLYKTFKFRVMWGGKYVAGVSKVSGLTRATEVVKQREGGSTSAAHQLPGQTSYPAITLERGLTHDEEFAMWANKVWAYGNSDGNEVPLKDFRKDIVIELYNEAGQKVIAYKVFRCWVSEYHAMPDLDASGNTVAIQKMKLENEGWVRDTDVKEPTEGY